MKRSKLQISNFKFQINLNNQKDQLSPIRSFLPTGQAIINLMGVCFMVLFLLLPFSALAGSLDSPSRAHEFKQCHVHPVRYL